MDGAITNQRSLDDLGILRGTDKSSLSHGYLRHYERILGHLRYEPITLLEIGVFNGSSLLMWGDFFASASIVGVDINPACAQYAGGRREVEIGSQADPTFLDDIGRRRAPHAIIDDGSHQADHIILTFRALFRHLQPGGIYIIEDLHFHAGGGAPHWRGSADVPPQDVLLQIARMLTCPGTAGDDEREWARQVDSVEFFYGGIAIRKKPIFDKGDVALRRSLVERANRHETWAAFAIHSFNVTGNAREGVESIHRAIEQAPHHAGYHDLLSVILERSGDAAGAMEAAREASRLAPHDERLRVRLGALSGA